MNAIKSLSLSAALCTSVLLNLAPSSAVAAGLLEKGRSEGLSAGIANEQPYAYIGTDGKVTGAYVDVLKAILGPLGIHKLETPITRSGGAFIVKAGNPLNLHSLKDVASNGKARLATQAGTNQVQEARDSGVPAAN